MIAHERGHHAWGPWLALVLVVLGSLVVAPAAVATFPGANGKIAFVRGANIWVMDPDGRGQRRLTAGGADGHPRWSPDGRKIAFDRYTSTARHDVWVINADGSASYRVTKHIADDASPAWSPDGAWLVFSSDRRGRSEIFKIRSTAPFGTPVRLTSTVGTGEPETTYENPYLADYEPNWSPDGTRIAFRRLMVEDAGSSSGWSYALFTMKPDGSRVREAAGTASDGPRYPNWGPGGAKIAWTDSQYAYEDYGSDNIWHSAPDGTSKVQVTHFPIDYNGTDRWILGSASWSPYRGRSIVFSGLDPARWDPAIYRVASNGSSPPILITRNGQDPDWGPAPS